MLKWLPLVLFLIPAPSIARASAPHRIDKALAGCLDQAMSTAAQSRCSYAAYEQWDKELNRAYGALAKAIDPSARQALKSAQQDWLKHRDTEFALIDAIYSSLDGTMYIPMRVQSRTRIVQERTMQLLDYLDLLGMR